ncbi:MAG: hypothetical protein ACREVC_03485 [Burkholderiales bacterium]
MNAPRLELDYVAAPRRPRWPGMLMLVAGLAFAAYSVGRYRAALEALSALEPAPDLTGYERAPASSDDRRREQERRAESVVRRLGLPWAPLLEAVEAASGGDVALLRMQPQADSHSLLLTAEAKTKDAMLDYLRRLSASPLLFEVRLTGHRVRDDEPAHPVRFDVRASFGRAA